MINNVIQIASPEHLYNSILTDTIKNDFQIHSLFIERNVLGNIDKFILYNIKLLREDVRIIHFHHLGLGRFTNKFTIKGLLYYLRVLNFKTVWTIHDVVQQEEPEKSLDLMKMFYENVDVKIVHSPQALDMIKKYYRITPDKKTFVIPHISFNDVYEVNINREECRRILGIEEDQFVVSFIGAIRLGKGIIEFLEMCKELSKLKNIKFLIAGKIIDKANYSLIEKQINSAKAFLGNALIKHLNYIPDEELQIYFNATDVVVIPHREFYTNSGLIVLSFAFKKPVITTKVGGNEFYVDEECGILVEPGSVNALVEGCLRLLNNRDIIYKMGEAGYNKMESLANRHKIAEEHYKLYMGLI